jgi:disulfide bond formation protein DsbB
MHANVPAASRSDGGEPAAGFAAASPWAWAALLVALAGLAGSLSLSLFLGYKACPLCFYQRTFVMSVVGVLGVGLLTGAGRGARLGLLALPLATAGLGVGLFHVFLEGRGTLECPAGILGQGSAPQQSLAVFAILFALLLADAVTRPAPSGQGIALLSALILGALLALGSCTSNPPMPGAPGAPYRDAPEICRPPYRSP